MKDILCEVVLNERVAKDIYKMVLKSKEKLPRIWAGQFLHLQVPDKRLILRRPFCIYDHNEYEVVTYYAVVGKGTESLTSAKIGSNLSVLLPLGNGFEIDNYKNIALLGGGMGCAELFMVTKTQEKNFYAYLGFASKERMVFVDDFKQTCKEVNIFTSDGSVGKKGYALPQLIEQIDKFDAVLICGPLGMVKSAKEALKDTGIPAFVTLEQRMGYGIGACLVCTCKINEGKKVRNKRVCMDGPVFNLKDVIL